MDTPPAERATTKLQAWVPTPMVRRLERIAAEEDDSFSSLIRRMIREWLKERDASLSR